VASVGLEMRVREASWPIGVPSTEIAAFHTWDLTKRKPSEHGDIEEVGLVDPSHQNDARCRLVDWQRKRTAQRMVVMSAMVAAGPCLGPVLFHHIFALTCLVDRQTEASGDVKAADLLVL
jgi:hypothetical protein